MNRNRSSTNRPEKKTSISSISSNIPLTTSASDQDTTRSSKPADVQTLLDSMKMTSNSDSKRGRPTCPPKGTVPYTVNFHDTLEKIALHFNSTPSELIHINKMSTRILFPGQIIFVPENSGEEATAPAAAAVVPSVPVAVTSKSKESDALVRSHDRCSSHESLSPPSSHQHDVGQMIWSMSRQSSAARPGRAQRLKSDASAESDSSSRTIEERLRTQKIDNYRQLQQIQHTLSIEESQRLDEECLQRFIKVHVCLMTEDRKSVAGTLLVTPNAVMFDPDVLDPLVKDFGIEKFGLIIRMDLLAGIALYEDIAMYEHEATLRDEEKRRMAQSTSIKNLYQTTTKISNSDEEQIKEIIHSIIDQIEKETDDETVPVVLFDASSAVHRALSPDQSYTLLSDDLVSTIDMQKHSTAILFDSKDYEQDQSRLQLEDCISVNNFSKRFGEIDKLLQKQHEFYVTPHPIEIPYYLCVKTSQSGNDRSPHSSRFTDDVYGKKELDTEYWFSVPKEKVDHLYAFFLRWSPERETSESSSKSDQPTTKSVSSNHINRSSSQHQVKHHETPTNKGFVLLSNDDSETIDDYLSSELKNNSNARGRNSTSDSNKEQKKSHYLKRQNTLLKEWEIPTVNIHRKSMNI